MGHYIVKLHIQAGEYEKASTKLIEAPDANKAGVIAIEGEAHRKLEWDEYGAYDCAGDFYYRVKYTMEVAPKDVKTLCRYL